MSDKPQAAPPKSLAAKIAEVVKVVSHVEKRGHNDFHNYDYATASDVLDAVRKGLAERNVVIVPRVTGQSVVEKQRKDKPPEFIVTADMILTVLDGDTGEAWECKWLGCGQDAGDKGIYKALTGGYKYFLLQLFMIPTGDDPEKDTRQRKESGQRPAAQRQEPEPPAGPVSGDAAAIVMLAGELQQFVGKDPDDIIRDASGFTGKDGKKKSFSDPTKQRVSDKWLASTRQKLEGELMKHRAMREPGVDEAVDLFDGAVIQR
jgi:hypothetical protein